MIYYFVENFYIHTYGCQMNVHEAEKLAEMLCVAGFSRAENAAASDILIFQTCSIRDTAARKVLMHISQANKLRKKQNKKQIICVIGCLSATEKIDGADIVLGTNKLRELADVLAARRAARDKSFFENSRVCGNSQKSIIITHGCENFCTYCIVPYARGREISRTADEIFAEFEKIKNGGGVIYLLGQNVNSFKCPKTGLDFVGLLDKLCAADGDFKINFLSSHPKDFGGDLVDCIARNEKIERNIHLPLQCGCDRILKLMNRKYTVGEYLKKVDLLRERVPDVHITTDIICGFPTETEDEFNETVEIMRRVRFNAAFIFPYSRRKGTAADKMEGHLEQKIIKERTNRLINLQREFSRY
jgi:tRNA-2-methylthio-N6-dimethylallyladenosine synthase